MSKDRNIDDAELANISGAGSKDIAQDGGGGGGDVGSDGTGDRPPEGGGGVTGPDHDTQGGGDQEFGPA